MSGTLPAVTDATFASEVLAASHEQPVIVDYWAIWCGPCRQVTPVLEEFAATTGAKVVAVDADANPAVTGAAGVVGLPTINVYVNGEVVHYFTGAKPKSAILADLNRFVG